MHTCSLESQKTIAVKTPVSASEDTKSQGALGYTYHPVRGFELLEVCVSLCTKLCLKRNLVPDSVPEF